MRSPYRVCPLGAHIDHQLGPVTAMAIDRSVFLAYAPSPSGEVRLSSLDFPGVVRFDLDDVPRRQTDDWGNFPRGAALALRDRHRLERGIVGVTTGKLHGGGVSSSAAVGVAFLLAFEDVNGLRRLGRGEHRARPADRERLPRPAQRHPRPGGRPAVAPRPPDADRLPRPPDTSDPGRARPAAVQDPAGLLGAAAGPGRDRLQPPRRRVRRGRPARCSPPSDATGREPVLGNVDAGRVRRPPAPPPRRPGPPRRPFLLRGRPRPPRRRRLEGGRPGRLRRPDDRLGRELDPQLRMRQSPR